MIYTAYGMEHISKQAVTPKSCFTVYSCRQEKSHAVNYVPFVCIGGCIPVCTGDVYQLTAWGIFLKKSVTPKSCVTLNTSGMGKVIQ